jgi:hypothetical protein
MVAGYFISETLVEIDGHIRRIAVDLIGMPPPTLSVRDFSHRGTGHTEEVCAGIRLTRVLIRKGPASRSDSMKVDVGFNP